MSVGYVCTREVVILEPDTSIREAARLMRQHHVGTTVVVEKKSGGALPVGILTDRDIVMEVVAEGVELDAVSVGDVMSRDPLLVQENDEVTNAMEAMRGRGVRRAPVVDADGLLVGIVSIDDLIEYIAAEISELAGVIRREQKRELELRA